MTSYIHEVSVLTSFAMVFLMHIYALQEFSHHSRTCEGQPIRQEDADGWSAGISNLLAIHSAEEVIASTTTCKGPHCLEMKEQVRSGQQPDQQVCIFTFAYLLMCLNLIMDYIHTYIHTYSTHRLFFVSNFFLKYVWNLLRDSSRWMIR